MIVRRYSIATTKDKSLPLRKWDFLQQPTYAISQRDAALSIIDKNIEIIKEGCGIDNGAVFTLSNNTFIYVSLGTYQ